jgi:hypothetical protein
VSSYFGPTSDEAAAAAIYFLGFTNSNKKPGALLFSQYNTSAVAAYLRGGNAASAYTLAQLQAIAPGTLVVTIDGVARTSGTITLSGATSFSNAASLIQTALNATPPTAGVVTGSIAATTLTVTAVTSGVLRPGQILTGTSVTAGTVLLAQLTGTTGGIGTYSVTPSQTVSSTTITGTSAAATVTFDSVSGAFVITSGITGALATVAAATGAMAAPLLLTTATGAVTSQGAAAAAPGTAMSALAARTTNWAGFTTLFDPDSGANTNKLAFAAWVNGRNNRYWYVPWDTDVTPTLSNAATTSLGYLLALGDYSGTTPIWTPTYSKSVMALGYMAAVDYDETNGRATMAFKSQTGQAADVVNETVGANLLANGYTFYGAYGTANDQFIWFYNGNVSGPFAWVDSYLNQVYLNNDLQLAIMSGLKAAKSVPYNARGYATVQSWCMDPINAALNFGSIVPGVTLSEAQKVQVNALAGTKADATLSNLGYYLQVKDATAQVRAARGVVMGVDGKMSAGYVPRTTMQTVNIMPDQGGDLIFDAWLAAQKAANELFFADGILRLPSIQRSYIMTRGVLKSIQPMVSAQKVLVARPFIIEWESTSAVPF